MSTVSSWLRPFASVLLAAPFCAAGCSSGSGDLQAGSYAHDNHYDENVLDPKTGQACTHDAATTCGFKQLGTKVCTCGGGVYTQCPCFPPKTWQGELTAPYCDSHTAKASILRGQTCTGKVGKQCIDRSEPDPTKQQGCSCIQGTPSAQWACGAPSMVGVPENAPPCIEYSTGLDAELKDRPCAVEWEECISRKWVDGTTPYGCVCLSTNGTLAWACGSTNKWFVPE
jgi:hypothetical protein